MADLVSIEFDGGQGFVRGDLNRIFDIQKAEHLLREAVDDIADKVEDEAKRTAPVETGALKAHPVDRNDTRVHLEEGFFDPGFGQVTGIPLFGGGTAVRGPGGRFVKPEQFRPAIFAPEKLVARATLTIPTEPKHAIWVHDGTGIYGPRKTPIFAKVPGQRMKFRRWSKAIDRRPQWRLESVKGQEPQPYLENAFNLINRTYVPARIEILRAQLAAET